MGKFLRLAVFILVLGVLAAATGTLLMQERQRAHRIERELRDVLADSAILADSLRAHHARTQHTLLLLAGLAVVCVIALALSSARAHAAETESDHLAKARSEMRGLESLARATAAQRAELDQEREARHRSEQDLLLQQVLVNRALQDKVRLGRDLHDGLVQSLYAAGLVVEAARQRLEQARSDPRAIAPLMERAKTTLNEAIRQARSTIGELTPDAVERRDFPSSVAALIDHLDPAGHLATRELRISPALPPLVEPTHTELLQILRECVSNALRHGRASAVEIEFAPLADGRLRLMVRDNGRGFDPASISRGRGLDNLAARARMIGALLDLDTAPGRGATLTLTFPPPSAAIATPPPGAKFPAVRS